jgi:hypothetical protein
MECLESNCNRKFDGGLLHCKIMAILHSNTVNSRNVR